MIDISGYEAKLRLHRPYGSLPDALLSSLTMSGDNKNIQPDTETGELDILSFRIKLIKRLTE